MIDKKKQFEEYQKLVDKMTTDPRFKGLNIKQICKKAAKKVHRKGLKK